MLIILNMRTGLASSPPKLLVKLSHQRRYNVVPEYPVGIVRVVCYAVNAIHLCVCVCELELIFPTVTQAYFIRTSSSLINS